MTDRDEDRIRAAVATLVDAIEVPPARGVPTAPRRPSRRGLIAGVAAGLALLGVVGGTLVVGADGTPATSGGVPVLPTRLPTHRLWDRSQESDPLTAVAMTWSEGEDVRHTMLLATDLRTVRDHDSAGYADVAVSPDGRRLFGVTGDGTMVVEDLAAGTSATLAHPVPDENAWDVMVDAWTADSSAVYVTLSDSSVWRLGVDGAQTELPVGPKVRHVVPSPDGSRVALVMDDGVEIRDADGRRVLQRVERAPIEPGASTAPSVLQALWTPDGGSLVTLDDRGPVPAMPEDPWSGTIATVTPTTTRGSRTLRSADIGCRGLVMLDADRVLCAARVVHDPGDTIWDAVDGLVVLDLETGDRTVVATDPPRTSGRVMITVADDLMRRMRFSMAEPWVAPVVTPHP